MSNTSNKRLPRGPYKSGLLTQKSIIDAAIELLMDSGYHNFSLRKVALRVGISGGNLQHHFKSKQELTVAMLDTLISAYLVEFQTISNANHSPIVRLRKILEHVIIDLNTRATTVIFPELWSLANHDKRVSASVDDMYERYRAVLKTCITEINPTLNPTQVEKMALFICASLEGHTMFIGYNKKWTHHTESIVEMAFQSFLHMIEEGNIH
ncbi:MAG: AcrR family transcriptional regulator [Neolewinella sp.]|jgi:AcrR family transcriptional regulator